MTAQLNKVRRDIIDGCNPAMISDLLDDLREKNVLMDSEVEHINESSNTNRDRCRAMIDSVKKKGDYSSNILIESLVKNHKTLANHLGLHEPPLPTPPIQEHNEDTIDYKGVIPCSAEEFKKIDTEGDKIYKVQKSEGRRRLALIICNEKFETLNERSGAKADLDGMTKLLNELGYQVHAHTNLTKAEMVKAMKEFAAQEEHADSDSTFIVLMSHGDMPGVCGTDSKKTEKENGQYEVTNILDANEIFSTFNNINCSNLENRPKVIIIQACRGDKKGGLLVRDDVASPSLEDDGFRYVQKEADFICFCSSTPDTVSWRDPIKGSVFITRLIEKMNELSHCQPLVDIFREVQSSFKDKCPNHHSQMPTIERCTLTKKFYLFPGY